MFRSVRQLAGAILLAALLLAAPQAALAAGGAAGPGFDLDEASWSYQPALLDVTVNGQPLAEPALLLQGPGGAVYARSETLRQWRFRPIGGEAVRHDGETWHRIDNVAGLRVALSLASQSVALDADPRLLERERADLARYDPGEMTPAATGAFLNYDLFAEGVRGEISLAGALEAGVFTPHGVGVASFVGRAGPGDDRLTRLETSWTIDRPGSLTSIRIGDSIAVGGPGASPYRFAGIQFGRNFAIQPGFITMPLPMVEGSAAVPSVVDVYVNNALQGSRDVQPGAFELANVPVQTGGGTVRLVVRDLLGRQLVSEYSYYASNRLLRRGLHDFSFEAGFVRRDYGRKSNDYGEFAASTTHRYGVTDRLTAEAHLQASADRQAAAAAITYSLFDLGLVGGSVAVSRSERGTGLRAAVSYERRGNRFSFGGSAEYASAAFTTIGQPDSHFEPRYSLHAFADLAIGAGTIGANIVHRDHHGARPDETLAGAFASFRLGRSASAQLYARRTIAGTRETAFGANLSIALGGRSTAFASGEYRRGGASSGFVSVQRDPPTATGTGYRLAAAIGPTDTVEAVVRHNGRYANYSAHLSHGDTGTGVRLSTAGSLGLIAGRAFAARSLGTSFAAVKVGEQEGVRVYADNQLVGTTGRDGMLIVPALRAWDRNLIRIEETDLPLDVQAPTFEIAVRPFARSGALVRFEPRRERGALLQIRLEDGSPLPAGALVRVEGSGELHPVASGGEVYLPQFEGEDVRLVASWEQGRCELRASLPPGDDPQPRIENLICRNAVYATR